MFTAFGVTVAVSADTKALYQAAVGRLPPDAKACEGVEAHRAFRVASDPVSGAEAQTSVWIDETLLAEGLSLSHALHEFESHVQLFVAESAPEHLFVHAGVVEWRGRALVMPGRSFSGKSCLVEALVGAGATYYSDEYAVFDRDGHVHPYARPMSLREPGDVGHTRRRVLPHKRGTAEAAVPAGAIFLCRYRPDGVWNPKLLTPGQGALELVANTVPARRAPRRMLEIFERVVLGAAVWQTDRGAADVAAREILAEAG